MKIAYVCADRGIPVVGDKGASVHVQSMVRAFLALGHEVKIICARAGELANSDFDLEQVSTLSTDVSVDRADKEHSAMAIAAEIERRLLMLYQHWSFDMIYERYSLWSAAGCRVADVLQIPAVVEVNAPLVEEQALYRELKCRQEARAIESDVLSSATVLAAVSREVSEYLVEQGAPSSRVHTLGNAVDTTVFSPTVVPAEIDGISDAEFVVGFSGSLKMWHGIDVLMNAFQDFHRDFPISRLLVVGDGPKLSWAQGFVAGAGLDDVVHFTGWVPHEKLPGLLARMDVATAPYPASPSHYFSPLKLYEYLAVGCPIVASRIGQTAELLRDGDRALLVEPGDAKALGNALSQLHNDQALSQRLSLAAAVEGRRHDWRCNAQRIIELARDENSVCV